MAGVSLITGGRGLDDRSPTDFYPTPTESTRSLFKYMNFKDIHTVLEPACGLKHISNVVKEFLPDAEIESSDLYDYGDNTIKTGVNFLTEDYQTKYDLIVTNPPYSSDVLLPFVEKSLQISNRYVCMFLKATFLESDKRFNFFKENPSLKTVLLFSNRQPLYKNGIKTKNSNAIMYAWFIWDNTYSGNPQIELISNSKELKTIKEY